MDIGSGIYKYSINKYDLASMFIYQVKSNIKLRKVFNLAIITICMSISSFIELVLKMFIKEINIYQYIILFIIIFVAAYLIIKRNLKKIVGSIYAKDIKKNPKEYMVSIIIDKSNIKYTIGQEAVYDFSINDIVNMMECSEAIYIETNMVIICIPNSVLFSQEDKDKILRRSNCNLKKLTKGV